jgi:hypothetical protein
MPAMINDPSQALSPGVYGILVSPPRVIRGISLGYLGYAAQFDAGQVGVGYLPQSGDDLVQTYEPRGTARKKSGWYGIMAQLSAPWYIVRVAGGSAGISPPTQLTATVTGTPGAATVSWVVTALNANGETVASQTVTVTTANATLSSSPVQLAWAAVAGALTYSVYRTVGGPSQGKISTAQAGTTLTDNGIAASGSAPTSNASGWTASSLELYATGGSFVVQAISPGAWGNSMTMQILAASSGDATKRNLVFTITNSVTGTTTYTIQNLALNQATTTLPGFNTQYLVGSITWNGTMSAWPASQTYTLTNGSDGATPIASDYTAALDQLGLSGNVTVIVTDDTGDSIRGAVNSSLVTHCTNAYDRVTHITGSKTNSLSAAQTDKAGYTSELATYYGAWVQCVWDDGTTMVDVPLSIFGAVIRINVPVHWSIANHDPQAVKYLQNIKAVSPSTPYSTATKTNRDTATQSQIVLPIQGAPPPGQTIGPWQLLHGRDCNSTSGYVYECVTWYRLYLLRLIAPQLDSYVNGPNDVSGLLEIQGIVNTAMKGEETAQHVTKSLDPNNPGQLLPAWSTDVVSPNSASSMATGFAFITINAHHPGVREFIIIRLNVGETVTIAPIQS